MAQKKTIWINHDPQKVDVSILAEKFGEAGYDFIAQAIPKDEALTVEMANKADVILSSMEPWNENTLSQIAGKGKMIMRYGAGTDNIDIPTATKYNIPVANIPGANATTVAETAMLHILNLCRYFYDEMDSVKKGGWSAGTLGTELDGKVLGLLGYGNIARQLSRMISGFDMTVLAYDPFITDTAREYAEKYHVTFVDSREELFSRSDIVSLHIPLMESTRGSVNKALFDLMKPTACLVNTCRGGVINEPDLIEALNSGKIRAAGLDVICHEPRVENDPIYNAKNVYITPHVASNTKECGIRSQLVMFETADAFLHGKLLPNVINRKDIKMD